ncbi:hypothetical protein DPMN_076830 [Dreissena polymorpha]|uniref:Uncharacterized protein n=1 Tax=Dreissena polymorpha TaxID=45954 RepID=A0A9D3YJE2_DREPO|nr:hypothetical protein DPMN_076830 [Dreissena polymorpha]
MLSLSGPVSYFLKLLLWKGLPISHRRKNPQRLWQDEVRQSPIPSGVIAEMLKAAG